MEGFSGDLVPFFIGIGVLILGATLATKGNSLIARLAGAFIAIVGLGIAWKAGVAPGRYLSTAVCALVFAIGIGIATGKGHKTTTFAGIVLIALGILGLIGTGTLPTAPFRNAWDLIVQLFQAAEHGFKQIR